jgi:hypothetical protein
MDWICGATLVTVLRPGRRLRPATAWRVTRRRLKGN